MESAESFLRVGGRCDKPADGGAAAARQWTHVGREARRGVLAGRRYLGKVAIWQNRLTPLWRRCAGGCHLNRKMDDLIRNAGFELAELSTGYARGPRAMAYMYEGQAF